jgi:sorting and assembly machinery component 37
MHDSEFILHIWPGKWSKVPSVDASCLAALLVLQLTIPGRFAIVRCTDPDISPSGGSLPSITAKILITAAGQLPFLTHEHRVVSPLSSIVRYIASLKTVTRDGVEKNVNADLDAQLSSLEKAQRVAWYAHIEANVGDLLVHPLSPESTS